MAKAVIFDLDGVLIDSQPFHFDVDMAVLSAAGVQCSLDVVENYAGMANFDRWTKYKKDFALEKSVEELIAIHVRIMNEFLHTADLNAINGVRELILWLKENGYKMAVASSSSRAFIEKILAKIGLINFFDVITSGEEVTHSKPAPDVFLVAAQNLRIDPSDCFIIEDSTNGVQAAVNAKIRCVGYINKSSGKQDLSKADVLTDNYLEFLNNLKNESKN